MKTFTRRIGAELISKYKMIVLSLPFIGLIAFGLIIYSNTFHGEFQFDDGLFILNNPAIYHLADLEAIWKFNAPRFIGTLSFALNYYFFGIDPFGFHLVNFTIHVLSALAVYGLTTLTFATPKLLDYYSSQQIKTIALSAAYFFIAHPLATTAVNHITQRYTSLAALFYLSALCCYIFGRLYRRYAAFAIAGIFAVLAMLTKQSTATLPLMFLAYEYYFFEQKKDDVQQFARRWIPILLTVLITIFIFGRLLGYQIPSLLSVQLVSQSHDGDLITAGNYLLTQPIVILNYIKLFFIPYPLSFDYDFPVVQSLWEPASFLSVITVMSLIFLIFLTYKKHLLISFGLLWFFLTLSVESSFIPISYVIVEYRMYLPLAGLSLVFCAWLFERFKNPRAFLFVIMMIVLIMGWMTYSRNNVWKSQVSFWEDAVRRAPFKSRPYDNLGQAYYAAGNIPGAIATSTKALQISPNYIHTYNNLANIYMEINELDKANEYLLFANARFSKHVLILNSLGLVAMRQGRKQEASQYFQEALQTSKVYAEPALNLAHILISEGKISEAISMYQDLLRRFPYKTFINFLLVDLYLKQGDNVAALKAGRAILNDVKDVKMLTASGNLFASHRNVDLAKDFYFKALAIDMKNKDAALNLGKLLGNLNKFDEAIALWEKMQVLYPDDTELPQLINKAKLLKSNVE